MLSATPLDSQCLSLVRCPIPLGSLPLQVWEQELQEPHSVQYHSEEDKLDGSSNTIGVSIVWPMHYTFEASPWGFWSIEKRAKVDAFFLLIWTLATKKTTQMAWVGPIFCTKYIKNVLEDKSQHTWNIWTRIKWVARLIFSSEIFGLYKNEKQKSQLWKGCL